MDERLYFKNYCIQINTHVSKVVQIFGPSNKAQLQGKVAKSKVINILTVMFGYIEQTNIWRLL